MAEGKLTDHLANYLNCFYRDHRKVRHKGRFPVEPDQLELARDYSFLNTERSYTSTYPLSGVSSKVMINRYAEFCSRLLEPATGMSNFEVSRSGVQLLANLPESGHRILKQYAHQASNRAPALPCPGRTDLLFPRASSELVYLDGSVKTLGELLRRLSESCSNIRTLIAPSLLSGESTVKLSVDFRRRICNGINSVSCVLSALRTAEPSLVWIETPEGLYFCPLERTQITQNSENVWDHR
ncbi:MAG: hypothetical protein U5N86_08265 [Planctomycetota bacterium]|nr:hypothetical protein [Planctomycetota bacterium]